MKKIYFRPNTKLVPINGLVLMQETSNAGGDKGDYSGGQLSRRRNSFWEDDEDE